MTYARDDRRPFSLTSTHNITFDKADKPILSIGLRSKIGFLTTERIIAALASVQIHFSNTSRQTAAVPTCPSSDCYPDGRSARHRRGQPQPLNPFPDGSE